MSRSYRAAYFKVQELNSDGTMGRTDWKVERHPAADAYVPAFRSSDNQTVNMSSGFTFHDKDYPDIDNWKKSIPLVGPSVLAYQEFVDGRPGWGLLNTALAASDASLAKSLMTGIAKGGVGALSKNYKTWKSWRKFYGSKGFAKDGQQLHHWALKRNGATSGTGLSWKLMNQKWNLMPMSSQRIHTLVHHGTLGQKLWFGTPNWFKLGITSTIGHTTLLLNED